MLNYIIGDSEEKKLRQARAELLVALRDLVYKDAELMEDISEWSCDYCDLEANGHAKHCHFGRAVDILFETRAQSVEGIRTEARRIREALVDLASDDYLMLDETEPCTHCDGDVHAPECPLRNALIVVMNLKKEKLI